MVGLRGRACCSAKLRMGSQVEVDFDVVVGGVVGVNCVSASCLGDVGSAVCGGLRSVGGCLCSKGGGGSFNENVLQAWDSICVGV